MRYQAVQLGYQVSVLSHKQWKLLEEQRKLRVEINNLGSLEHIETVARNQLGLGDPRTDQVIQISKD